MLERRGAARSVHARVNVLRRAVSCRESRAGAGVDCDRGRMGQCRSAREKIPTRAQDWRGTAPYDADNQERHVVIAPFTVR